MVVSASAPFEYAKLMGQTNQSIQVKSIFRGLHWQLSRTTVLLLPIFCVFDVLRRKTKMLNTLAGNFAVTFGVVGLSYACSWPLETLKNLAQAGQPFAGASVMERIRYMGGPVGLFRGLTPGPSAPASLLSFDNMSNFCWYMYRSDGGGAEKFLWYNRDDLCTASCNACWS